MQAEKMPLRIVNKQIVCEDSQGHFTLIFNDDRTMSADGDNFSIEDGSYSIDGLTVFIKDYEKRKKYTLRFLKKRVESEDVFDLYGGGFDECVRVIFVCDRKIQPKYRSSKMMHLSFE